MTWLPVLEEKQLATRVGWCGSDRHLIACPLSAYRGDRTRCRWCNRPLTGRQQRWCGQECVRAYQRQHHWRDASRAARERDDYRCVECQASATDVLLEVHHLTPCLGRHSVGGCHHHLIGLVTLCVDCHLDAHRVMRGRETLA